MVDAVRAVLLVGMDDHLAVALAGEAMPFRDQVVAQIAKVVNLAVEDERQAAIFVEERLPAAAQVDDLEAARPHAGGPIDVETFIVRPAVTQYRDQASQERRVDAGAALAMKDAGYPAHDSSTMSDRRHGAWREQRVDEGVSRVVAIRVLTQHTVEAPHLGREAPAELCEPFRL